MFRVTTHPSWFVLDLNVLCINTLVENRQRELVFGFIKFVSASSTCEHLQIKGNSVALTLELALCTATAIEMREKGEFAYISELEPNKTPVEGHVKGYPDHVSLGHVTVTQDRESSRNL